jgi:peptidyl-dipeptidase Dcp
MSMSRIAHRTLFIVLSTALSACGIPSNQQNNPLLEDWSTPFGVPPYDEIHEDHFPPAFEYAIAEQRREVESIAANPEPATFANTIEALDASGALLARVSGVFGSLSSAPTNDRIQEIAKEVAPNSARLEDYIRMNAALFERVRTVYERRAELDLDPEQRRLLEETHLDFVRGGAALDDRGKQRLREINSRLSTLTLNFGDNVLAETNAFQLFIENDDDLAGLPENLVKAAAEAAVEAGRDGQWLFTLHYPSIWPFLQNAENRELRRQIFTAYISRGANDNEHDNRSILTEIAALRAESARLLGYPSHAHFQLERRMAKTPDAVYEFLNEVWRPALAMAKAEARELQAIIEADGHSFLLEPWDWWYYTENLRRTRYQLDEEAIRQYFQLDNVLAGAFEVARRLFGVEFTERSDIPSYHEEVRSFEVTDSYGSHLGVFLADYHPRASKRAGAWSGGIRGQWFENGVEVRPIVVNVGNFSRPTEDTPSLLGLEEVETLFHELGHGLHALLSDVRYRRSAVVTRDFVELPSQIMENWMLEPEVLEIYATHYRTGEVIPDDLVAKIRATQTFNQGFRDVEYLAASFLDMDWHTLEHPVDADPQALELEALSSIGLISEIESRYRSPYFGHVFAASYSAGYYSYFWSEVLDADAFQAFKEAGLFDRATAESFRRNILEPVGSDDPAVLYRRFRGRDPVVGPLLERHGFMSSR